MISLHYVYVMKKKDKDKDKNINITLDSDDNDRDSDRDHNYANNNSNNDDFDHDCDHIHSQGKELARARINYSSAEMNMLLGKKKEEIESIFGESTYIIDRENIVLLPRVKTEEKNKRIRTLYISIYVHISTYIK